MIIVGYRTGELLTSLNSAHICYGLYNCTDNTGKGHGHGNEHGNGHENGYCDDNRNGKDMEKKTEREQLEKGWQH